MKKNLPLKGYTLDTIYYTTHNGVIKEQKFTELLHEEDPHISKFYKGKAPLN